MERKVLREFYLITEKDANMMSLYLPPLTKTDKLFDEVFPIGYGVSWVIHKLHSGKYSITMWKYNNTGYRFVLDRDKLKKFGEYLNECSEYMLAHGDPI